MSSDTKAGVDRTREPKTLDVPVSHLHKKAEPRRARPYRIQRNLIEFITFSWIDRLMKKGRAAALVEEDLPTYPPSDNAHSTENVLEPFWNAYEAHVAAGGTEKAPSFATTLTIHGFPRFLLALFLQYVTVAGTLIMPALITQVIDVVDPTADHSGLLFTSAYDYAALYFALAVVSNMANYASSATLLDLQINIRSSIIGAIYRKTFRLSLQARAAMSPGALNSFVDSDASTLARLSLLTGRLPSAIVTTVCSVGQIAIALYLLSRTLGVALSVTAGVYIGISFLVAYLMPRTMGAVMGYMRHMDGRSKLLRELIYGMRTLKLEGAENVVGDEIKAVRTTQMKGLLKFLTVFGIILGFMIVQQDFVPTLAIISFHVFGGKITAQNAFTILALMNVLIEPSAQMVGQLMGLIRARASINRIATYLVQTERTSGEVTRIVKGDTDINAPVVVLENASFAFGAAGSASPKKEGEAAEGTQKKAFELNNISLSIPRGAFVCVVGPVGSGKSALLSALTGSMTLTSGTSYMNGSVGICPQEPYIMSGTVESNIRGFAGTASPASVAAACTATCLDRDLSILPQGLKTAIGEKGISLSGGQKARVQLARAVACNPDIYVLDDPLAALDAHVGKTIFENTIRRDLRGKTIILATHSLPVVRQADFIIVFADGQIVEQGSFPDLNAIPGGVLAGMMANLPAEEHQLQVQEEHDVAKSSVPTGEEKEILEAITKFETSQAVAEDRRVGTVKASMYARYFKTAGWVTILPAIIFPLSISVDALVQITLVLWSSNRWGWTDEHYFLFYSILGVCRSILAYSSGVCFIILSYTAARAYHDRAMTGLLNAPVSWFDHQPAGRILNRMCADVQVLDFDFPMSWINSVGNLSLLVSSLIVMAYNSPYMLVLFAVLSIPATLAFRYFQTSYRELKRLSSILQSPLSAHVSETLNGVPSIMAYGWVDSFVARQEETTDMANTSLLLLNTAKFWVSLRLSMLSSVIILLALILAGAKIVSPSNIGLMLVSAINITATINVTLLQLGDLEASFNAVERLDHYATQLPVERTKGTATVSPEWPATGQIEFADLSVAYSDAAPAVVRNFSLTVVAGEHVAIVGRSGAGKSSLCAALFRLNEARAGKILIDREDISRLDLNVLRSRLMIVPQDPVLFSGTFRTNMDRNGSHTEDAIWHALELSGMKSHVANQELKLDAPVTEGGGNLSHGQRQLLTMSKALLRKDLRVLVLDESTAAVDGEADTRIGELIAKHFEHCTVITIAHRLQSIAGYDRVAVMDDGELVECASPHELLRMGDDGGNDDVTVDGTSRMSLFAELVEATGSANADVIREIAARHFAERNSAR
ncbi:Multidrug resistance-associated protein 1 [Thoreauomyces humboldtii]|nr:Multidrug resistance-associated protein 1 [Thoreauomyces humboldtii]